MSPIFHPTPTQAPTCPLANTGCERNARQLGDEGEGTHPPRSLSTPLALPPTHPNPLITSNTLPPPHVSQSDTRTLAFEAGRLNGIRVNTISAGPLKSRAASAIGGGKKTFIEYAIDYSRANAPLQRDLSSDDVGNSALFLCSDMAKAVTGQVIYGEGKGRRGEGANDREKELATMRPPTPPFF